MKEPLWPIGALVEYCGKRYHVVAYDGPLWPVVTVWLRAEGGRHYVTATTRELKGVKGIT